MNSEQMQYLWREAEKIRGESDIDLFKHLVLSLIFLRFASVSSAMQSRQQPTGASEHAAEVVVGDIGEEYHGWPGEHNRSTCSGTGIAVARESRWETLQNYADWPNIGEHVCTAMASIEADNPSLCGALATDIDLFGISTNAVRELIELISTIRGGYQFKETSKIFREIYEYFLTQYAIAEGDIGGEYYTPSQICDVLVVAVAPGEGRVFDPCCGVGSTLVKSADFAMKSGGGIQQLYGQENYRETRSLAAMNLAICGLTADFGSEAANVFRSDQFQGEQFDYILADPNPPFNRFNWGLEGCEKDKRWQFGTPPEKNANYAWLQHVLWKLAPGGRAGVVLAASSANSTVGEEGAIREAMVRKDVVDAIIALPGQLFYNTQIPACLWLLAKGKTSGDRGRVGEILFIDAGELGKAKSSRQQELPAEAIRQIGNTVQAWRQGKGYADIASYCKVATIAEIEDKCFDLVPANYVGNQEFDSGNEAATDSGKI